MVELEIKVAAAVVDIKATIGQRPVEDTKALVVTTVTVSTVICQLAGLEMSNFISTNCHT